MVPKLVELGIGQKQIQLAIVQIENGTRSQTHKAASKTTYIRCPVTHFLWDLKPVVGLALENANANILPRKWQTPTYFRQLLKLGFTLVRFDHEKGRKLGINDCDLSELDAPHIVFWPDGREERDIFQSTTVIISEGPNRRKTVTNRFIRNSAFAKQVRRDADGVCDACGLQSFLTPSGERFLEVHHKHWLSDDGPDVVSNMVALCPNCHKQEHYGTQRKYH